ncbi:MAG: PhzF family phenazine biosynthesis protein [Kangiella sp.]|jgi:predicted PhzF superfamily epimerase YddE/YHI9|nr:PhzF family phenazine biosynthesis protein [Kangiella sp.]
MQELDGKKVYYVSVFSGDFHGKLFAGTEALVFLEDEALTSEDMQSIAKRKDIPATCFVWPSDDRSKFHIRFYNPETEIQLCGHGLLAAAQVVNDKVDVEKPIEFITQSSHIKTKIDDGEQLWIGFDTIDSEPADIPAWAEDCCNIKPVSASKVGPSNGYWIFEWPQDFDLTELAIDFDKLTFATERALIATTQSQAKGFDYDLRYFAPQHGVNEDKATGSANRVLASYWKSKLNRSKFKARQLSAKGAVIEVECESDLVWISGKVTINA